MSKSIFLKLNIQILFCGSKIVLIPWLFFLIVIFISFLICYRIFKPRISEVNYLFEGNNLRLSITSNISSFLSISIFCFGLLNIGYINGLRIGFNILFWSFISIVVFFGFASKNKLVKNIFWKNKSDRNKKTSYIRYCKSRIR